MLAKTSLHQNPLLTWTATTTHPMPLKNDQKKSVFRPSVHLQERNASSLASNSRTKSRISDSRTRTEDGGGSLDKAGSHVTVKSCVKGAKRKWDKRHYCLYCKKTQSKMSKHLLRRHRTEKEVAPIVSLPPKSKTRIQTLEKLQKKGDYNHNISVLQEGKGEIVTYRQPTVNVNAQDFLPCSVCFGFFVKSDLWRHEKVCREPLDEPSEYKKQRRVQTAASALLPYKGQASQRCSDVVHRMNMDDVSLQVKNDALICEMGDKLLEKHSSDPSKDGYVSQKMRELGRFLLAAKFLDPEVRGPKFSFAVKAARKACGLSKS